MAAAEGDGLNHGNAPISTATIPPMEILEAAYPVMFRQWALRPDSGGPGEHRGGLGAVYEIELLEESARRSCSASAAGSRPRAWRAAGRRDEPLHLSIPRTGEAHAAAGLEDAGHQAERGRRCGWRRPAAAATARRRIARRRPSPGTWPGLPDADAADAAYGPAWREAAP
jgi:N-methylhydantoinase B